MNVMNGITPLLLGSALRAAEEQAQKMLPAGELMRRAGLEAAKVARQIVPSRVSRVVVLAGPGNNGGDGFEMAAVLQQAGYAVSVCAIDNPHPPADAQAARQRWQEGGGSTSTTLDLEGDTPPDLIVDALFGIGLSRPITGQAAEWIAQANRIQCRKLALDIPSGLSADSGQILGGPAGIRFCADHTATFIAAKPGLYMADGVDCAGEISLHDLGVILNSTSGQLNQPGTFSSLLPQRHHNTHKGLFGNLAIVGGQRGMTGAVTLTAHAGLLSGAGRVYVLPLDSDYTRAESLPELMFRDVRELESTRPSAVVAGPGMGTSQQALEILQHYLTIAAPLLLDADALNLLASDSACQQRLQRRSAPTLLTPHPLEAARLLHTEVAQVQADRIAAALTLAQRYRALVVLKGAGSVLASFEGEWCVNPTGNAVLSTPGSGDVLSGVVASLAAQGMPAWSALCAGVWLHGRAADELAAHFARKTGVTATEILQQIRALLNQPL